MAAQCSYLNTGPISNLTSKSGTFGGSTSCLEDKDNFDTSEKKEINCLAINLQKAIDIFRLTPPTFIKIDIEGGEFTLIPSLLPMLQQRNIKLLLSIHINYIQESKQKKLFCELLTLLSTIFNYCIDEIFCNHTILDLKLEDFTKDSRELLFLR